MLLYCVSRPTERDSNRSCVVDDQVVPAGTSTSLKRLLLQYNHLSTTKTVSGNANTRVVILHTTGEESTGAEQSFRLCNRRLHSIDDG
jgi:hypothetical protein